MKDNCRRRRQSARHSLRLSDQLFISLFYPPNVEPIRNHSGIYPFFQNKNSCLTLKNVRQVWQHSKHKKFQRTLCQRVSLSRTCTVPMNLTLKLRERAVRNSDTDFLKPKTVNFFLLTSSKKSKKNTGELEWDISSRIIKYHYKTTWKSVVYYTQNLSIFKTHCGI